MNYSYNPNSKYEQFGLDVCNLLVEKHQKTYFVGGMVRDFLLQKEIFDIDIATNTTPKEINLLLQENNFVTDTTHINYGVVVVNHQSYALEISTLRKDTYGDNRYPKVEFIDSIEEDSKRRDFTINALYMSVKHREILDFHNGLADINKKIIRFIGNPLTRIKEDPLRIIRAYRFQFVLGFSIEEKAKLALEKNMFLIKNLSETKINYEINKVFDKSIQKELRKVIHKFA